MVIHQEIEFHITRSSVNYPIIFCLKGAELFDCTKVAIGTSVLLFRERKPFRILSFCKLYTFSECAITTLIFRHTSFPLPRAVSQVLDILATPMVFIWFLENKVFGVFQFNFENNKSHKLVCIIRVLEVNITWINLSNPRAFYIVPLPFTKRSSNALCWRYLKATNIPSAMVLAATSAETFFEFTFLGTLI